MYVRISNRIDYTKAQRARIRRAMTRLGWQRRGRDIKTNHAWSAGGVRDAENELAFACGFLVELLPVSAETNRRPPHDE